ncbi:MAG: phosphodiester glycosidase family protein [Armatimonadota bacterium]
MSDYRRLSRGLKLLCLLTVAVACWAQPVAVAPGLTLECERVPEGPWEVRVLRLDRSAPGLSLDMALGMGKLRGVEKLSGIIARESALGAPVVAAVNADFFVMAPAPDAGLVSGLTVRRDELVVGPRGRPAFVWLADGSVKIGSIEQTATLTTVAGTVPLAGFNQQQAKDGLCAYTSAYGWPLTDCVVLKVDDLPLAVHGSWPGRVAEIVTGGATREAGEGEVLLRAGGNAQAALATLKPADEIRLEVLTPGLKDGVSMAAAGNFILLRDGQIPFSPKPSDPRHPRTMIGYNDREIIIAVVDGRQPGWSVGMTYHEQALLMQRLGCTDALNLDGGGSTTCWVGGKVVNQPSGGMERRIANAILIRCQQGAGQ